jgi:hypothetical protein
MWAQISGMADCCGAGVIGRLSGLPLKDEVLFEIDLPTLTEPYKEFKSMRSYVMDFLPTNRLWAGPPEWLHWAILEDLLQKKESGHHTPQIKAKSIASNVFDFEENTYHKFWAGPSYKVQLWFITDRVHDKYMSHPKELACIAFIDFIENNNLGKIWRSESVPGSYGKQQLIGAILHPNYSKIASQLPSIVKLANEEMESRWKEIETLTKNISPIKDKVACQW